MKTIQFYIANDFMLFESNIINAGSNEISIKDADGNEVDLIHTFDRIMGNYLEKFIFNARTTPPVRQWFERNFMKWVKNGAPDRSDDMMDEERFQQTFYVPLHDYINLVMNYERDLVQQGKLSSEIILNSFPDYVKKNPADSVVFSGGRLFRLKKLTPAIERLHEYLVAVEQNLHNRNDIIVPQQFLIKRFDVLQVPEGFKRTEAWHRYTQQMAEKVSREQARQMIKSLKPNVDYRIIAKLQNLVLVQLLTANMADVEGRIMKHCVASYGYDIEKGKTTIYSFRDLENYPVATIEMKGDKSANQVKGPHNSTIKPEFHAEIRNYFKTNKISVGADAKNFGGMKSETE